MTLPDDTDYLCTAGGKNKTHFTGGPDEGQPFDPAKLGDSPGGYVTYNGHPVSNRNCTKHVNEFLATAQKYARQRHASHGTVQERNDAAERAGRTLKEDALANPYPEEES